VLAGKNARVVLAVRNTRKGKTVAAGIKQEFSGADIDVRELDVSSLESVKAFAEAFANDYDRLDVLINNAGIMMCPFARTADGFEIQMGTNHLGHFALTGRLLPMLKQTEGSRVVSVSSFGHKAGNIDFDDLNWEQRKYDTNKAYADSKLANLYFTYELARRAEGSGGNPLATAAHPGYTATDLQRHSALWNFMNRFWAQDIPTGALPTLRAAFDPEVAAGNYYGPSGFLEMRGAPVKVQSSKLSYDENAAPKLWEISEKLTGVDFELP